MKAKRIADLVEFFGVNTFSSLDTSNTWGSWPADYSPDTVIRALRWIVGDTGYQLPIREYHYSHTLDMQKKWFKRILAEFPDTRIALCPGANAPVESVKTMMELPHTWVEGLNEPNTDFGSGEVPYEHTKAIQDACWNQTPHDIIMGPSIVAGTPGPQNWIKGYCETDDKLDALNEHMSYGNGHYYPPGSPDVPDTGYSVNDYVGGLWTAYDKKPIFITEFCSLLYNNEGHKDPDKERERSSYYTITTLFRMSQNGTMGLWWYALFDYGDTYKCGLFPTNENNPRGDAYIVRALAHICPDKGSDRRSFNTDELEFDITGVNQNIGFDLYQGSDNKFYVTLWQSLPDPGGDDTIVNIDFATQVSKIEEYNLMNHIDNTDYRPVQTSNTGSIPVQLNGSARVLVVTP